MTGRPAVTRRQLLIGLGTLGGAGALLGAMQVLDLAPSAPTAPFEPPRPSDLALQGRDHAATVVVLGAGVAGLAAAYELEKGGYRCEVLEARDRPGGRNWTVRTGTVEQDLDGHAQTADFADDIYFNAGPARIAQHHVTLDYCRELGVDVEVYVNANPDAWYYHEGRLDVGGRLADTPVRQRAAQADLYGGIAELLAKATDAGALDADLTGEDRDALLEFLRGFGALAPRDRYLPSGRRGYSQAPGAGQQAGSVNAPYPLSDVLASGVGAHVPFGFEWDQAMPMFQPVGGMDRLPQALAAALRGPVRYGAEVVEIRSGTDGVAVVHRDGAGDRSETRADYCICTLPPPVLARVTTDFPSSVFAVLTGLEMMPTCKVGLEYGRRFWETDERIFGGITWTNLDIGTMWYPSSGYLGQRGLVVGAYNFLADAEAFASMTPAGRVAWTVEQGAKIHGRAYRDLMEAAFSVAWSRTRFSEGGWVLWEPARRGYALLARPVRRVHFAGDHLSHATSWQHGALESARAAVTAIHEEVLAAGG